MISSRKTSRLAALAAVASLALAACTPTGASPSATGAAPTGGASAPASAGPSAEPGTLPTPDQLETKDLQIGFSVTEVSQYAGVLAEQLGIYEKYGLNVEYQVFEGDARVAAALQAGQIQIGFSGTSSSISSQLTDVPYDAVAVLAVILTDDLVCQAGIDTAEEVKGKTIAISTFGGTSNAAALLALKALELQATDAVITQVGGQSARLAALQGKSIDCAIIDSNMEEDMIAQGFGIAARLKEAGIEFGRSGMAATATWLEQNPNTALVAVAAVLEAQNEIFENPDAVVPHYAEFSQREEAEAASLIEDFTEIGNRSLMWTDEAFRNPQKAIAVINPDIIDIEPSQAYNRSFLEKLDEIGFYEKIGSPDPTP